jgi:hypothetical protein
MNPFMKLNLDSNICCIAVAFLVACVVCASPVFFLRDRVLGKLLLVAGVVAMTVYHRIAGIIALVAVIALLNQNPGIMEGMEGLGSTPEPVSFKSPAEFREKYCMRGIAQPASNQSAEYGYMLNPSMATDNKGKPELNIGFFSLIDFPSFKTCKGGATINNICDPACNWTMNPAPTATAVPPASMTVPPASMPMPTTMPPSTSEGFTPMSTFRPHIRTGRQIMSNGVDNVKSFAKRLQRQLF